MSIKLKMAGAIVAALLLLFLSSMATQYLLNQTKQTLNQVIDVNSAKLELLNNLQATVHKREIDILIMSHLDPDSEDFETQLENGFTKLKDSAKEIGDAFAAIDALNLNESEKGLSDKLRENVVSANTSFSSFSIAMQEGFIDEARVILTEEFRPKYMAFSDVVTQLLEYVKGETRQLVATTTAEQESDVALLWVVVIVSMLVFAVIGWWVSRDLNKSIGGLQTTLENIAATGDLSQRVPVFGNDELANVSKSTNYLLENISQAITEVDDVMDKLSQGNFDAHMQTKMGGDFAVLSEKVNGSLAQMRSVIELIDETSENFRDGIFKLSSRDRSHLSGSFLDVIQALEIAATHTQSSVSGFIQIVEKLSEGDFSVRSNSKVYGDLIPLQQSLNHTFDNLEMFVNEVSKAQSLICDGDLTARVSGNYPGKMGELRDALNTSVNNMAQMVSKVNQVANSVAHGVSELANGSQVTSVKIREQVDALVEASQSIAEMTQSVSASATNANQANQLTQQAQTQLMSGVDTMQQALSSMDKMSEASQKIAEIISLIDGIAFQTNLLALNAAVEAARAGEHGRGFAVVAGEVRNLAGKSADAASEIKSLIENSVQISKQSGDLVNKTSDALSSLNENFKEVSVKIDEIAHASSEQAQRIQSVNNTVQIIDNTAKENAELVAQAASSSNQLSHEASTLEQTVQAFKVDGSLRLIRKAS